MHTQVGAAVRQSSFFQAPFFLRGHYRFHSLTKRLLHQFQANELMFLRHADLDRLTVTSIVRKRPAAIINLAPYVSGAYAPPGVDQLLDVDIPLFQTVPSHTPKLLALIQKHPYGRAVIWGRRLYIRANNKTLLTVLLPITRDGLSEPLKRLKHAWEERFKEIAYNTASFMQQEIETFRLSYQWPQVRQQLKGKNVLILIRSATSEADLNVLLKTYDLSEWVFVGVDGGADVLLEHGLRPHIVIGDFDSISDRALTLARERCLHAYKDGWAPERERLLKKRLSFYTTHMPGTSEDVAIRMVVESGAQTILVIGRHQTVLDALEKNRKGLASTVLLSLMYGHRFFDITGIATWHEALQGRETLDNGRPSHVPSVWMGMDTV